MDTTTHTPELQNTIGHLFRNESAKMVVVLTRLFGFSNIGQAEDIVQDTVLKALQQWRYGRLPQSPQAWLYAAAKNAALDVIRRDKLKHKIENEISVLLESEYTLVPVINEMFTPAAIEDSRLRMMFACCHPEVSGENQITLILKTLCGFSTAELAKTFITSEDGISKRLYRTKEFFRANKTKLEIPAASELPTRIKPVLNAIYLLFNEGYNSTNAGPLIRDDLMAEAMQLCQLLTQYRPTQLPPVFALMALMCFHAARNESRLTPEGEIILLPHQDRSKWKAELIALGNEYLNKAATGNEISPYHLEAAIAYEHCIAKNFESTNWNRILERYEWLCRISVSPISELNKTIALMQVHGPARAMEALAQIGGEKKLASFYLYHSLLGEIQLRLQEPASARKHFEAAIRLTQSETEQKLLRNKIAACVS